MTGRGFTHDPKRDTAELEEDAARCRRMATKTRESADAHSGERAYETRADYWEARAANAEMRFRRRVESNHP